MKLQSLRLHGFKSFADRTTLEFREGVTAIVGSNGCGKSNIADAIRWVLGEQRASAIRGAKMEEVIFQGTTRRRALNFAEVTLQFDNEQRRVAVPQREIEVSRKVFREGGSEYSLNRNACRLRDVQGLLRDTGLGSNAYAIIEAGMIETLLSDRAEERRALFEEAAGIGRYKDSRQAAMRRLDAAEADLARLEDLIAEVESKVRSLHRQKRRAERYQELRTRRLDLEVAVATAELVAYQQSLEQARQRHARLAHDGMAAAAERASAEARLEERRIEAAQLTQQRSATAARLEQVRRELDAREREVLLADERRSHAELRIEQLARERQELEQRRGALQAELAQLGEERVRMADRLETLGAERERRADRNEAIRARVTAERLDSERAAERSRELAREIATLEGDRAAARRRADDAAERLGRQEQRERELRAQLSAAAEQTELWSAQQQDLRARLDAAGEALEAAREEAHVLRRREQEARDALRAADDRLSRLAAQTEARDALERSYEGFAPAVAAVMAERGRFAGVHGPLADFVATHEGAGAGARAVERFLGSLLQALVVEDLATARALRRWFREEWSGGGSLLLLPRDALARAAAAEDGPEAPGGRLPVRGAAEGADWVDALLARLQVVEGDPLHEHRPGTARVGLGAGGAVDVVDARGVVRLTEPEAGEGFLERREALEHLRRERDAAHREREQRQGERDALREAYEAAEERAREADELRRAADAELRRTEADSSAFHHQRTRLEQDLDEVVASIAALRETGAQATEHGATVEQRLAELARQLDDSGAAAELARERLAGLEAQWEQARDEEAELRVAATRAEAELREAERRLAAAEQGIAGAGHRRGAIDREAQELRATLDGLSGVAERAGGQIEELFAARDREAAALAALEQRLAELEEEAGTAGERARAAARREGECAEERHRLELSIADLHSRTERVRERLEVEWGRPWQALVDAANAVGPGEPGQWRAELADSARQLDALGPVNMLAMEEHEEEQRRLHFLHEQRDDLVSARDDLIAAIRQINRTAREVFQGTFDAVREHFVRVFQSLFQGGECDVWLADPDDPLESPIEIQASPKGKKTQRIHLLSGGERTLTALALLFALYLVKPSPFCVLDEVDAPLDESNVGRFLQLLEDFKAETQFIVITHNPRTMESADWVYGVTMEEPGVSAIVGVELLGAFPFEGQPQDAGSPALA